MAYRVLARRAGTEPRAPAVSTEHWCLDTRDPGLGHLGKQRWGLRVLKTEWLYDMGIPLSGPYLPSPGTNASFNT